MKRHSICQSATWYVNENPSIYTLFLSQDVEVSAEQTLNATNAKLTIIGIDGERKISRTTNGRTFLVGASNRTGIELISVVGYQFSVVRA